MRRAPAAAKINLALVVGPLRGDGRHEVTTVLQRFDLADRIQVEPAPALRVRGFADDTIVRAALEALAAAAGVEPRFEATITKRIPVAAGLGGGSSDAATTLRLANELLPEPLAPEQLAEVAGSLGADVPFFLAPGPQLGEGDGRELTPAAVPQDFWVLLVLPHGETKRTTADVYAAFEARGGEHGYAERRAALLGALDGVERPPDLAALPPNDLASSALADELRALGAFRADVSGAGPTVYGLFTRRDAADAAKRVLERRGRVWVCVPAWYF
jgi:4-diphosphocytidyl-2-C-methyl-D-erythritol kinase